MPGKDSSEDREFSSLFEKYYKQIYGNTLRLVKVQVIAEDIAQQVFLNVWERRQQLAEVENPKAWLFQIARNLIASRFREKLLEDKYLTFAMELLESNSESPEDIVVNIERAELLDKSLEGLSPKQKQVYQLSRQDGKTYEEIATELGIRKDTVKEYIQIALAKIRQYLITHKNELISIILFSNIFY
ncbi:RNA polymerase sigma factor [Pedobacter africanus]|uniref:RNA polymerase sigma factor n=1 Tax=Pedobacter africanus TaxID=151894 RepID=A0A1W1Z7B0_9SPHI|nr:sigma-70 family RNA polymerase sigma factor [Pedobacter africanus]SMC44329.1 RNA polymerase sigma-70 factor, ECF subfamily [Pedobacter africanus]